MPHSDSPRLVVLMFTDLVDSSGLKVQLGDADYVAHVARPHNDLLRRTFAECHGTENNYTGDGFLATFASVADAVNAALLIHDRLRHHPWQRATPKTRIGIHLGDSTVLDGDDGHDLIASHAADVTARVMSLGLGGQTLLTRAAFDSARQYVREHPADAHSGERHQLVWLAHGQFQFKGKPEPVEIFEVGAHGLAPLTVPPDGEKAHRIVTGHERATLGWRPGPGLAIPRRDDWTIQDKLGEGGFGEVWLAQHRRTKELRVFKFCFDAERVRHFKRELTLFKLLREVLGERPDISKILEVQLDDPPYFLESDYVEKGNLRQWAETAGGIDAVPLETRLALLAQVARAVAAAHSIGIIHKDLKPSNILIEHKDGAAPQPVLADFGVGTIADRTLLSQHDITMTGLTQGVLDDSSDSGTRLYQPPEMMVGQPPTLQGDVYALGVMLYQLSVGDLNRPLGSGWECDLDDPILCADVRDATHRDPVSRLASAADLADRIESLDQRRQTAAALDRSRRRARRAKALAWVAAASLVLTAFAGGLSAFSYRQWQRADKNYQLARQRHQEAEGAQAEAIAARRAAEQNARTAERRRREAELAKARADEHARRAENALRAIEDVTGMDDMIRFAETSHMFGAGAGASGTGGASAAGPPAETASAARPQLISPSVKILLRMSMARLYHDQGQYDKARESYEAAADDLKKLLDDPASVSEIELVNIGWACALVTRSFNANATPASRSPSPSASVAVASKAAADEAKLLAIRCFRAVLQRSGEHIVLESVLFDPAGPVASGDFSALAGNPLFESLVSDAKSATPAPAPRSPRGKILRSVLRAMIGMHDPDRQPPADEPPAEQAASSP